MRCVRDAIVMKDRMLLVAISCFARTHLRQYDMHVIFESIRSHFEVFRVIIKDEMNCSKVMRAQN